MSEDIITIEEVMDLAFMFDEHSPIDWGRIRDGKEQAMRMIASSIIEQFQTSDLTYDEQKLIMISAITKLTTENMLLYTELMESKQ